MKKYISKKLDTFYILWSILNIKRKRQVIILQILSFSCAISEFLNLFLIRFYLDNLLDNNGIQKYKFFADLFTRINFNTALIGFTTIIIVFASSLLRLLVINYQFKLSGLLTLDIGTKIYNNIINKNYKWHLGKNTSYILGILSSDIEKVRDSIISSLAFQINSVLILFISVPLFLIEPKLMLFLFLLIIVFFFTIYRAARKSLREEGISITKNYQYGLKLISESLGSIKDILIESNQNFFLNKYKNKFRDYHISFGKLQTKYQSPRFIVEGLLIGLIIFISIFMSLSKGIDVIEISAIGTILIGIYKLLVPFQQCSLAFSMIRANTASWKKIRPFLEKTLKDLNESKRISKVKLSEKNSEINNISFICLENISFRYENSKEFVLKNLNLKINKGQKVALVGYSGSGKSTCGDLISGLLKPDKGKVYINGKNINNSEYELRKWHKSFAHVPQNIFVLEDTIINNIAFGIPKEKINFNKIVEASKKACLHNTIINLKNNYQEIIGENGKKLSGGQLQRLAIARAFYKDAKCIIFDEATNSLDNKTENELLNSSKILGADLTIIFITHRLTWIKNCDLIVFFEGNGKYSLGNYDDLIKQNQLFKKFISLDILKK